MQLGLMLKDMQLATRMAVDNGTPLLIAGRARSLFEFGARELGGTETLDAMAHLFERMAGVSFKGCP
jgi:3-hydroxyisobutyrate dehydrogenase